MVLGSLITTAVFYFINKQNENEERENLKAFLASFKDAKSTQKSMDEALNDPKTALVIASALTVVIGKDELFYYRGSDCGRMERTDLLNVKEILRAEKEHSPAEKLMIIIKKTSDASLRNSMDLLDAISAAGIPAGHFADASLSIIEKNCIQNIRSK